MLARADEIAQLEAELGQQDSQDVGQYEGVSDYGYRESAPEPEPAQGQMSPVLVGLGLAAGQSLYLTCCTA